MTPERRIRKAIPSKSLCRDIILYTSRQYVVGNPRPPFSIPTQPVCDRICFDTFSFENLSAALNIRILTVGAYLSLKVLFRIAPFPSGPEQGRHSNRKHGTHTHIFKTARDPAGPP